MRREHRGFPTDVMPTVRKESKKEKFAPSFLEQRRQGLDVYVNALNQNRSEIMRSKFGSKYFLKFVSPVQYGDTKPDGFIMPWKVE